MKKIMQKIFNFIKEDHNSYYNTNKESGKTLITSKTKANKQELKVLKFFEANNKDERFSAEDVLAQVDFGRSVPITSVRRAMTNLTYAGYLKDFFYEKGTFGKQIHTWQIND